MILVWFGLVQRGGGTCGFWRDKEKVCESWREYRGSLVDWRTRKNQPMYTKDNDPTTGRTASFIHLVYHKLSTLQFLSLFYISLSFVHHFLFTKAKSTRQALSLASCSSLCTLFFMQNEHPSC